jgi:hypothetical protein
VTPATARRLRLVRLAGSVGLLVLLLAVKDELVGLVPTKLPLPGLGETIDPRGGAHLGIFILATVLGTMCIRETVMLIVSRFHGQAAVLWRNLSTWILYALLALWLASTFGVNLSGLLVGGAILGVVIATASQASLGNFFAGLILMLSQPYRVGASIRLRSALVGGAEYEGTVIDQGALYTTLRGSGGEILKLPNSAVVTSALVVGAPPLQSSIDLELPARTRIQAVVEGMRARLGSWAEVAIEPQGFKAGGGDRLVCRLEVRSATVISPASVAEALVAALEVAARDQVAA